VTQPWSTPIGIAESPNPTDAMLAKFEPGAFRSRIKPFAGLTSFQKKLNEECWSVSSSAAVGLGRRGGHDDRSEQEAEQEASHGYPGLEQQPKRETMSVFESTLVGPGVVDVVAEIVERAAETGATREPDLGVLEEQALPAEPHPRTSRGTGARCRGSRSPCCPTGERIHGEDQLGVAAQHEWLGDAGPERERHGERIGVARAGERWIVAILPETLS
jgi:hypothetical protein